MELFKKTNFDFLRHKWPFIIASLVLSAAGIASLVAKGGPRYGIEFKGGLLVEVKFQSEPQVEKLRALLTPVLSSPPTVQAFEGRDKGLVSIETEGGTALEKNKAAVLDVLAKNFGHPESGKLDLNNASVQQLRARLSAPLQAAGVQLSDAQVGDLSAAILAYRNTHGGLLTNPDELKGVPGLTPQVLTVLNTESYLAPYTVTQTEMVGAKVAADLQRQALSATLLALAGMLIYVWFRFEWIYGVGAVLAVFHDTVITIGLFSLFDKEISLTVIAALLTLVGYSMNDTIVIFDRIRENLHLNNRESLEDVVNKSVNQTLSRTVMTSGLTFLAVIALYLFGGPVLHGFSFALVMGIIVGTYSSVFVASPIVVYWHSLAESRKKVVPATGRAR